MNKPTIAINTGKTTWNNRLDPHEQCRISEITNFNDIENQFLDYRCEECRTHDTDQL